MKFTGKFVLEEDEVNPNNEPDEKGEERRDLIVEGTSRWCWCHPFFTKSSFQIARIIEKFINFIKEKITCLTTDADNEW